MGRIGKTHGVCMTLFFFILLYFSRFVKDFSTFSVSWAVVQLIFCPLGNREVRIGFTASANPSADRFWDSSVGASSSGLV